MFMRETCDQMIAKVSDLRRQAVVRLLPWRSTTYYARCAESSSAVGGGTRMFGRLISVTSAEYRARSDHGVPRSSWGNGTTEVMIWMENHMQVPLGSVVPPEMTFGGQAYDVYRYTSSSDGGVQVISLLSTATQTSGSVDLKEILDSIVSKGWIEENATINQIGYGVEICSTEDQAETFYFTDFSVTMN